MPPVSTTCDDSVTNDGQRQLRSGSRTFIRYGSPDLLIGEIGVGGNLYFPRGLGNKGVIFGGQRKV